MRKSVPALAVVLAALAAGCIQVASDEVGVRVVNLPLPRLGGVEKTAKTTGTYFYLPELCSFYKLPKTQQKLEMIEEEAGLAEAAPAKAEAELGASLLESPEQRGLELQLPRMDKQMKMLEEVQVVPHRRLEGKNNVRLKTADGNDIWVDVVVGYQVIESLAPVVIQKVGYTTEDIAHLVGPVARSVVRSVLGELRSEEFYEAQAREQKLEKALTELNAKLNPFGIAVTTLTAPEFRFSYEYENLLRDKALAEQKRQEYERLQLAAEQEKAAKKNKAAGEADAEIALAQGRKLRAEQEADAVLYAKTQQADAVRARLMQEAAGLQALVPALAGPGGEAQVAREIARALQGKKILLVPAGPQGAINVLDLNELLQTYGALKAIKPPLPEPPREGERPE